MQDHLIVFVKHPVEVLRNFPFCGFGFGFGPVECFDFLGVDFQVSELYGAGCFLKSENQFCFADFLWNLNGEAELFPVEGPGQIGTGGGIMHFAVIIIGKHEF